MSQVGKIGLVPPVSNDDLVSRELNYFKATLATSLSPGEPLGLPCVSPEDHALELSLLADTVPRGNFYFVVDYRTGQLEHVNGFSRWLGWDDAQFRIEHYVHCILPSHLPSLTIMAASLLRIAKAGNFPLGFVQNKCVVQLPLRHRDGTYWLCRRTLSPWQFTTNRQILAVLNEYSLVKPYEGEPLSPYILAANGIRCQNLEELLRATNYQRLLDKAATRPFTTTELRIARKLAYNPNVTVRELSDAFKSSERTIETHLRNIRTKATAHFMLPFATSLEAARFIRGQALV